MFMQFARSMEAGRAFQPMMDADGGGSGGGEGAGEGDDKNKGGQGDDQGGEGGSDGGEGGDDGGDDEVKFDEKQQAHIDKIIERRIAKERAKAQKEQEAAAAKAEERAKMTAEQKAEEDRKDREKKAEEREKKATDTIIGLSLERQALTAGVPEKKLARFLKIVDRDGIELDDNGEVDKAQTKAAIDAALSDMPEFKSSGVQQGPGDDQRGGSGNKAKFSKQEIEKMTADQVAKNYDDVIASMKIHNGGK